MINSVRFAYQDVDPLHPQTNFMPILPLTLEHNGQTITSGGLQESSTRTYPTQKQPSYGRNSLAP